MVLGLDAGQIYQHAPPSGGNTPPYPDFLLNFPAVEFDSFLALGSATADFFPPVISNNPFCDGPPCPPSPRFDSKDINVAWTVPAFVTLPARLSNQDGFLVARITLSEDARGTFRYVASAGGVIFEWPEMTIQDGIMQGAAVPEPAAIAIVIAIGILCGGRRIQQATVTCAAAAKRRDRLPCGSFDDFRRLTGETSLPWRGGGFYWHDRK
jgi:hypothetical protein